MVRKSTRKWIAGLATGVTLLGLTANQAAAEEMIRDGTIFIYSSGAATQVSPQAQPVVAGVDRRYGLSFNDAGEFTNWIEYTLQYTYATAGTSIEWRTYGTYIFPDGGRMFYNAMGTTDVTVGRSTGTIEVIGGTEQYVNASGSGTFECVDPPSDPEGFPGLSKCFSSEPWTITY